ncbi:MAG: hypothetical protein HFJ50_01170 [Clostridia bacterium]|jgi:hypothetical protein|nr:hypothetical protein [Clostridia bacterium]
MEMQELEKVEEKKITNELDNTVKEGLIVNIGEKQNKFLESTFGKIVNTGVDIALRAILPNAVENEVIGIKNAIINDGFKEGIKTAVNTASNIGKSIAGIFTGKFDTVSQAYTAIKAGGIIDSASKLVDTAVKSAQDNNLIKSSTAKVIKKSKNVVKDCLSSKIEEDFMSQVDGIEKVGKYIENWNKCLEQKDLIGMKREHNKIIKKLNTLIPIESTLKQARSIENVQLLIKNKGNSLENITDEELKLAQTL